MTPRWCLDCAKPITANGKRSLPHRCPDCRRERALRNARERQRKFIARDPAYWHAYQRAYREAHRHADEASR